MILSRCRRPGAIEDLTVVIARGLGKSIEHLFYGVVVMAQEKVAIITAGGSGMGAAAAKRLAAEGCRIAILSSSGKGEALADELGGVGVTGSNQSNDDLQKLVDMALSNWGRIDVLVNSAGHGPRAPILEISDEDWHKGMDTYLMNVIRPVRLITPIMQAQRSEIIINISTAWTFEPSAMFPTSAVFRAGTRRLHQAVR